MPNQSIKENDINGAGTLDGEGFVPGRLEVLGMVSAGCHQTADPTQGRRKKGNEEENNVVRECWIRSNPTGLLP